ncbi:MAG: hypothetical protein ABIN91_07520 [Mucilaginibacter sp.]|uniref:hypothetical protein n=1 Tax=Mucilaginibacter sp. TaxID=1882438 RepID=UPI0032652FF4
MKLDNQQKTAIQQNLIKFVKYQETYQEIYDHILTSLETMDTIPNVQIAYTHILENDFGGIKGIEIMEKIGKKAIRHNIQKAYVNHLINLFKWPGILLPALALIAAYFDISLFGTSFVAAVLFLMCCVSPWLFLVVRNFIIGLKVKEVKNTYFGDVMSELALVLFRVYCFAKAILLIFKMQMGQYIEHAFFVLLIIHVFIFFTISVKQLKVSLR